MGSVQGMGKRQQGADGRMVGQASSSRQRSHEMGAIMLNAVEIKPDVYWVGAVDWKAREFHGYSTERGIT